MTWRIIKGDGVGYIWEVRAGGSLARYGWALTRRGARRSAQRAVRRRQEAYREVDHQ